jgi:glucose-6-phosphate isomerase
VAVAIGPENFADFLAGFHAVDRHFAETEFSSNVPALMGLLNVWYVNFFKAGSHAVLPYAQYLHRFPRTCSNSPWNRTARASDTTVRR